MRSATASTIRCPVRRRRQAQRLVDRRRQGQFRAAHAETHRPVQRVRTNAACRKIRRRSSSGSACERRFDHRREHRDLSGVNIALKAYAFALDEVAGREKNGSMEAIEASLAEARKSMVSPVCSVSSSATRPSGAPRIVTSWRSSICRSTRTPPPNAARTASHATWICSTRRST